MSRTVVAVDLGATSGRVIVAEVASAGVSLSTVHRFANAPISSDAGLHWDIDSIYNNVIQGLKQAFRSYPDVISIGVDSWAVDYGLVREGQLLGPPFHYRDRRTAAGVDAVEARISQNDLYAVNGLQFLPFNTLYQLAAEPESRLESSSMLLIPDLITYWLTGVQIAESTNASTTGLMDVGSRTWSRDLIERLALPTGLFKELVTPGVVVGHVTDASVQGAEEVQVVAVGSHDTASAVVGVPMTTPDSAFISCGTWGLVGVELATAVLSEDARLANFTNEGGVDGRTRFLRNVMGLWLLSESLRRWEVAGEPADLAALLRAAAEITTPLHIFDVNDPRFLPPGDMPARIADYLAERGLPAPKTQAEIVRCIVESMAQAFATTVAEAARLSGVQVDVVHMVGGGVQNELLCQLTADQCGLPVLAGPIEATALGNVLVQARAAGILSGELEDLRSFAAGSMDVVRYSPRSTRKARR